MTTELIPDFEEAAYSAPLVSVTQDDALVAAINRLAHAVEQNTVALQGQRVPAAVTITTPPAAPVLAPLPPVQGQVQPQVVAQPSGVPPQPAGVCPVHGTSWSRLVPAGIAKSSGKPYTAFWACPTKGCDQRPPRL